MIGSNSHTSTDVPLRIQWFIIAFKSNTFIKNKSLISEVPAPTCPDFENVDLLESKYIEPIVYYIYYLLLIIINEVKYK